MKLILLLKNWFKAGFNPAMKAGLDAEIVFEQLAGKAGWIIERIEQDKESFKKYKDNCEGYVKRADFICVNCKGVQIEVKCSKLYNYKQEFFYLLNYKEVKNLENMQKELGKSSQLVFAIFGRDRGKVIKNELRMFSLDFIFQTKINKI